MRICKQMTAVKIKQFYLYYYGTITFLQMSTTIDILYVSRYKLVTLTNHVYKLVPGHIQKSITLFSSGHPLYSLLFRYRYKYKYRYKNTMSVPYSSCITLTYKNVKQSTTVCASKNKNVITLFYILKCSYKNIQICHIDLKYSIIDLKYSFQLLLQ